MRNCLSFATSFIFIVSLTVYIVVVYVTEMDLSLAFCDAAVVKWIVCQVVVGYYLAVIACAPFVHLVLGRVFAVFIW